MGRASFHPFEKVFYWNKSFPLLKFKKICCAITSEVIPECHRQPKLFLPRWISVNIRPAQRERSVRISNVLCWGLWWQIHITQWAPSSLSSSAMSFLPASISIPQTLRFLHWVLTPCLPHMWTWGLYSWHRTSSSQVISIEPEHIIQQSILVLAAFQNIKIQISSKLYMLVGKLQHPVGIPIWLLSM